MKALHFPEHGGLEVLRVGDFPEPSAGPGEVLVAVKAAALNHLDLFVLGGLPGIPIPLPQVGGADAAGVVAEVGEGVTGWRVGDEVVFNPGLWCGTCEFCVAGEECLCLRFGIVGEHCHGAFAERVVVPALSLAHRPAHLSWEEAAALPLTFLTAWRMLMTRGGLREGETVLIHGIGGGVALAALSIATAAGARVFVTSSSNEKLERARQLGAAEAINYSTEDVVRKVKELTARRGVDLVVETVGEATWMTSLRCARRGGRIVTCGATSGPNPTEEVRLIFWNQLSILGSTMGSDKDWRELVEAVERRQLRPVVDSVYSLDRGVAAYERLAAGKQFGKIVLAVGIENAASEEPRSV